MADGQPEMWVEGEGHTLRVESAEPRKFFFRWMLDLHRPVLLNADVGEPGEWSNERETMESVQLRTREERAWDLLAAFNIPEQSAMETWVTFHSPSAEPGAFDYITSDSFYPAPTDPCARDRGYAVVCLGACAYLPAGEP